MAATYSRTSFLVFLYVHSSDMSLVNGPVWRFSYVFYLSLASGVRVVSYSVSQYLVLGTSYFSLFCLLDCRSVQNWFSDHNVLFKLSHFCKS